MSRARVAVVGAGVAGLGAAWRLAPHCEVTLFEADGRLGGHANTVELSLPGAGGATVSHGVDTGFLVYNERTYPRLTALLRELGVENAPAAMSFSVQAPRPGGGRLEWSGSSLDTVFADRANLLRPRFHGMLLDLLRFNRLASALARSGADSQLVRPLGEFLAEHGFGSAFRDDYLLPMISCIWSCAPARMQHFPVGSLIRFCHNHGLLQLTRRPQWYTVRGGSRRYVDRLAAGIGQARLSTRVLGIVRAPARDAGAPCAGRVALRTHGGIEWFDEVVLACHAPQSLALLEDASADERSTLAAIGTHDNEAVLHTDASVLPRRRRAWAAWNYERGAGPGAQDVCLHYLLNLLQPLPWTQPVIVSLNPLREPRPQSVVHRIRYAHPVFDSAAIAAQRTLASLQGRAHTWFCGAWTGYGFHEDGLTSGFAAADALLARHATAASPGAQPLREAA